MKKQTLQLKPNHSKIVRFRRKRSGVLKSRGLSARAVCRAAATAKRMEAPNPLLLEDTKGTRLPAGAGELVPSFKVVIVGG